MRALSPRCGSTIMADQKPQSNLCKRTPLRWARLAAHWSARVSAALLFALVLSLYIGEGLLGGGGPNLANMDWSSRLMFVAMLSSVVGFVVLWWRELSGGLLVLGGMAAFYWLNHQASGKWPTGAFPLFYIPGILAIASWALSRRSFR
jgi:hypothetical protein